MPSRDYICNDGDSRQMMKIAGKKDLASIKRRMLQQNITGHSLGAIRQTTKTTFTKTNNHQDLSP